MTSSRGHLVFPGTVVVAALLGPWLVGPLAAASADSAMFAAVTH
jgi:hypothetical protein